ncbi:hypothetical protein, partial [Alicyclobacillus suci]|uniref:hypothetical protein n=1 Tax=Alicyclobacillus suci TaxID=2816080 RepID=UPI001A8F4B35
MSLSASKKDERLTSDNERQFVILYLGCFDRGGTCSKESRHLIPRYASLNQHSCGFHSRFGSLKTEHTRLKVSVDVTLVTATMETQV